MSDDAIDYGPLAALIGVWKGDKGMDVAPEPDGQEENPFYETITFEAIGDVTNAESQRLVALHYRQIVYRQSDNEAFHDETGYWMWDKVAGVIMQSLAIPRAVSLLAGGHHDGGSESDGSIVLEVAAAIHDKDWAIVQSPFMRDTARTTAFRHRVEVGNGLLSYAETTVVDIYGKTFDHTDENTLTRID